MAKKQKKIIKIDDSSIKQREKNQTTSLTINDPSPDEIKSQLELGICTLFFYKVTNNEFRKMKCTLSQEKPIPSKYNRQGIMVVWDLDANQWRSFYPNRVYRLIRNEDTDVE